MAMLPDSSDILSHKKTVASVLTDNEASVRAALLRSPGSSSFSSVSSCIRIV